MSSNLPRRILPTKTNKFGVRVDKAMAHDRKKKKKRKYREVEVRGTQ